jgi:hypothetical protein
VGTHSWVFMIEPSSDLQFASSEGFNCENLLLVICYPCFVPILLQQTVGLDFVLSTDSDKEG